MLVCTTLNFKQKSGALHSGDGSRKTTAVPLKFGAYGTATFYFANEGLAVEREMPGSGGERSARDPMARSIRRTPIVAVGLMRAFAAAVKINATRARPPRDDAGLRPRRQPRRAGVGRAWTCAVVRRPAAVSPFGMPRPADLYYWPRGGPRETCTWHNILRAGNLPGRGYGFRAIRLFFYR